MSKDIYRPRPISGFPEWLPEQRFVELQWLDNIRQVFESYGFCSLETPSVEELDVLLAKGETDKEIYAIQRLQADEKDKSDARLALHFDLTVPFARYVAQHFNDLVFPFKRYQIQRVWRGERPQDGRYREFYQCDIDVIGVNQLPLHFDAELPAIMYDILSRFAIGGVQLRLNNRKILEGYYTGLGIADVATVIRIVDKLDKIRKTGVITQLQEQLNLSPELATRCLDLATIATTDISFAEQVRALRVTSPLLEEGLTELSFVIQALGTLPVGAAWADLSIARGFDYYTGTVYETRLLDYPSLGSICSGGRYDNLAASYINQKLPGVGMSIGFSRLFGKLMAAGKIPVGPKSPTQVLVILPSAERRPEASATADTLRRRGYNVELFYAPDKVGKQVGYASKKGIPYVWFPPFEDVGVHEVKDLRSGAQMTVSPEEWQPE